MPSKRKQLFWQQLAVCGLFIVAVLFVFQKSWWRSHSLLPNAAIHKWSSKIGRITWHWGINMGDWTGIGLLLWSLIDCIDAMTCSDICWRECSLTVCELSWNEKCIVCPIDCYVWFYLYEVTLLIVDCFKLWNRHVVTTATLPLLLLLLPLWVIRPRRTYR